MDDLVSTLSAMKIDPVGAAELPTTWTEFRTISTQQEREITDTSEASGDGRVGRSGETHFEDLENVIEIGDRVQIQGSHDGRVRVVRLTADHHEPELGFISASEPEGAAMLGAGEDEEVEFESNGRALRSIIVKVEKGHSARL